MAVDGQFGGRITFEFDGLRIPPCDGDITLDPSTREVDARANQDGSAAYSMKPKLPNAKIKLRHANGIDWAALMLRSGNVTIKEEDNGRTHLFTKTRLTGKPDINLTTGEVDGLQVEGGKYTRLET